MQSQKTITSLRRTRALTFLFWVLTIFALLGMGTLKARQDYLTRGIPDTLPQPINYSGPTAGLNVYLEQYDNAELAATVDELAATGIHWLKQSFYYDEAFDWAASDRLITAVTQANPKSSLQLVPLLDGSPANEFTPISPADFAAWAGEFAARYADDLQFYIIWDEPNITSHWGGQPVNPIEYAALLTAASTAIRKADSNAVIIAAPLAPTSETGPQNLADPLYLQRLYEAGAAPAFDIAAAKPYGFNTDPNDRRVNLNTLNFSRAILLREVMERNNDSGKALWAGNWGWNALPPDWTGTASLWGDVTTTERANWTLAAFNRAQQEWPWMGLMFLENWEPNAPPTDPHWGFSLANQLQIPDYSSRLMADVSPTALPGFHLADVNDPSQTYVGGWRFSPAFGADISETTADEPSDEMTFTFWGTDVGLRVRRANFRARLYITVDGEPANALPHDENGTTLILTAAATDEDYLSIEPIAINLKPGIHTMHIVASRGWDQWALNGFSVAYYPPQTGYLWIQALLGMTAVFFLLLTIRTGMQVEWRFLRQNYDRLSQKVQVAGTAVLAAIVALTGWLTWSAQAEGVYRRLGDMGQLTLTAGTAVIFYISPTFLIYILALAILFLFTYLRPAWGMALIAFSFPFYVLPKPTLGYLFSPVEIFTLITFAAAVCHQFIEIRNRYQRPPNTTYNLRLMAHSLRTADYAVLLFVIVATLSLFFTARRDVAANEWRVVIIEPALFYLLLRGLRPRTQEMWIILDAFVLGGVVVAVYGLWQVAFARETLITAEGGLLRLKSIFGSPNNVGLYLGRILPLLGASFLMGQKMLAQRRWLYVVAAVPIALAMLLSFSKGALFLGMPAALLFVGGVWLQRNGRSPWPWILAIGVGGLGIILVAQKIPALAGRLDLTGTTGILRLNLWRASINMFRDHPIWGVGLDNFLYAYRGRYILDAAWQEPNLNHPHNIILDFATRLGLLGLLSGGWLIWQLPRTLKQAWAVASPAWQPVVVGFSGAVIAMLTHGLVDHSFFLVDLAYIFYLMLGTAVFITTDAQEFTPSNTNFMSDAFVNKYNAS